MEIDNQYLCGRCNKNFRDAYNLRQHQNRKTPCERRPEPLAAHSCNRCHRVFGTKSHLTRHTKICKVGPDLPIEQAPLFEDDHLLFVPDIDAAHIIDELMAKIARLEAQLGRTN